MAAPRKRVEIADVRFRAIRAYAGARGTTYTVRWTVAGRDHQRTFSTRKLADVFRSELLVTARAGRDFSRESGMPREASAGTDPDVSWYSHACEFVDYKWSHASPRHRKGLAEALTDVSLALVDQAPKPRDVSALRHALYSWSFNARARAEPAPPELDSPLRWIEAHSLPLGQVGDARTLRAALDAISRKRDGSPAAASTIRRKRSALHSALQFAVELEHFDTNPMHRVSWRPPQTTDAVDRRVVVNPEQAQTLLTAVGEIMPAIEAFFACLYFAGLRPSEAVNLRISDFQLPDRGWGRLLLSGSYRVSGAAWTRSGTSGEEQALKHRATKDTRVVPVHPTLAATLARQIETFGTGQGGRLFVTRTGKAGVPLSPPYSNPLAMNTVYRIWTRARKSALSPEQFSSPLARRPYDLRHACLSTWLNAGVPATQVAEWAGHSVNVLLRVYATCIDGEHEAALSRIEAALTRFE